MDNKNIQIIENYIAAAYRGDLDTARQFLTEDITLVMTGSNQMTGKYHGPDNFFAAFGKMMQLSRGTYRLAEQLDWLMSDTRVVLLAREEVEHEGEIVSFDRAVMYEIRGEQIALVRIYEGDTDAADLSFR
ncbi:MAG: hypothetical protein OHK0046_42170 [Anaerolineae bacterium]